MADYICIYHGNCADGFAAAWVYREYHKRNPQVGTLEFHPGVYQNPPPDVTGKNVVMVDFSYKRPVLEEMAKQANSILILDHHKSAAEDLGDLPLPPDSSAQIVPRVSALFDMERSGAGITWDYFFPNEPRPLLIDHIEDRDLWRFKLRGTREIQACVFSHPYDFDVWTQLMGLEALSGMVIEGHAIERKHHKDIAELTKVVTRTMKIGGYEVPVANLPYTLTSDAGHLLAQGKPFAACYWDTPEGRVFSLRSTEEGLDVSEIAKLYGGGGHRNAAGFRVGFDKVGEFEV